MRSILRALGSTNIQVPRCTPSLTEIRGSGEDARVNKAVMQQNWAPCSESVWPFSSALTVRYNYYPACAGFSVYSSSFIFSISTRSYTNFTRNHHENQKVGQRLIGITLDPAEVSPVRQHPALDTDIHM